MPFATINNHSLHYTDLQPPDTTTAAAKATLILVHGLGSTQNFYFPILPYLTGLGFRCVVFDNYGAGRSEVGGTTSVEGIGGDVIGLIDHLRIDKAVVGGYSMGGMVPTYLAATKPERVLACVCIGPVHPGEAVAEVFKKRVPVVEAGGMEAMANVIPNGATGSKATPLHKAFIREMLLAQTPAGYIANCKAIESAVPPDYAKVKCPVLIIAGEEDKSAPLAGCERIFGELGTKEGEKKLEVLKGVGHWHCVESPGEVQELIGGFVDGLL